MSAKSSLRDQVRWQMEYTAKVPYLKQNKRGEMELTVDPEAWNSLESLEKAAYHMHSEVKNFWKWVKKVLAPHNPDDSSLRQHLANVVYFFMFWEHDEIAKWKEQLLQNNAFYYPTCF